MHPNPKHSLARWSVPTTLAALSFGVPACLVPQQRYDAVMAESEGQHAAIVNLQTALDQCDERRTRARQALAAAEADATTVANERSGLDLDLTVARRERDDAQQLVEQLRGELARVGRDVRTFAGRNAQLQESLEQAEARVDALAAAERAAEERTEMFSELALSLRGDLAQRVVDLELVAGRPVVLLLSTGANAEGLYERGVNAVRVVGRVVAARSSARVEVRVSPPAGPALGQAVAQALSEGGLTASRVAVRDVPGKMPRGSFVQLVIELAGPAATPMTPIDEPR